ncbi:MAG: tetratricopeptide repeat protein [Bacteroidia bacterium]|nr:tetratricopeptide repeat protein [Bacteroidia bacterium]
MQIYFDTLFKKLIYVTAFGIILFGSCERGAKPANEVPVDSLAQLEAVREVSAALESNPENPELYYKRAGIYEAQGYLARAEGDYEEAIRLDSTQAMYHFALGKLCYAMNQTAKAASAYEKALSIQPDFNEAAYKLADLYFLVKEHQKSIDLFTALIKKDPGNARPYHGLGLNYKDMKDTLRAIYHFQTAVENDPKDLESVLYCANLYAGKGNPLALEYYQSALKIKPKSTDALFGRAYFFQQKKLYVQALKDYRKVIDIEPENYRAYYNVGYIAFERGDYSEARRHWDIATRMQNFYPQAYYMKGLSYEIQGKKEDAIANYKLAYEQDPDYTLAKEALQELGLLK